MKELLTLERYSDTLTINFWGDDEYENFHDLDLLADIDGDKYYVQDCEGLTWSHRQAIAESIAEKYGKGMTIIFESGQKNYAFCGTTLIYVN